jgi:hypothetical protein
MPGRYLDTDGTFEVMEASESIESETSSAPIGATRMVLRFDIRAARKQDARAAIAEPEASAVEATDTSEDTKDEPDDDASVEDGGEESSDAVAIDALDLANRTARMPVPESVRLLQAALPTPAGCFSTARLPPAVVPATAEAIALPDAVAVVTDAYAAEPPRLHTPRASIPTSRYALREAPARARPAVSLRDAANAGLATLALLGAGSVASALIALVLFP